MENRFLAELDASLGGSTAKNKKKGTKLAMPVVYYSQLMTVAYGGSLRNAGLEGQAKPATGLEKIIERK